MDSHRRVFAGLDIGKTKMAASVITEDGDMLSSMITATDLEDDGSHVMDQAKALIREAVSKAGREIGGVGVCTIGIVDTAAGKVKYSSIRGIVGDMRKSFQNEFHVPVLVSNDVVTPAYGEYLYGASRNTSLSAYMTISTGFGLGIIRNGEIERGSSDMAGLLGPLDLYGRGKSIEYMLGGRGIATRASEAMGREVSTRDAFELAKDDRNPCNQIIADAVNTAAGIIGIIQCAIDPEVIVLGGSVATNQPDFVKRIQKRAEEMLEPYKQHDGLKLIVSELGQTNGMLGAVGLLARSMGQDA